MGKRQARVWISGRVQGVFFRAYTRDQAVRQGLTGWVRNMRDGRVEALFQGDAEALEKMLAWCREGSPLSRVDRVEVRDEPPTSALDNFEVRY